MSKRHLAILLASAAALPLTPDGDAQAQQQLPEIVVRAPSPIRRAPVVSAPSAPPAPFADLLPGTLPVVTDQFATVTVVPSEELRRSSGATLGDVLFSKPGITSSTFAPGAASRPIVRGLDVNRVGIVENGIGGGGVSDLGEDHFVPIDPLSSDQIEVIRGPATLRYGSQSIGGVVSATNNRIPEIAPPRGASAEVRGAYTSVDGGREGAVLLDAGKGNFAFHADAFGRAAENYRIPSYPYLTPPDPAELPFATQPDAFSGRQPNSSMRASGESVGGSYLFDRGFVGAAISQNSTVYSIPGSEGEGTKTHIDARQTKLTAKGEVRAGESGVDAVRFWLGGVDYKHSEIGLADPTDPGSGGERQRFTNREEEGRVEVQMLPFNLRFATLTTAFGVQAGQQALTAPGVGTPGLFDPNRNNRAAAYAFNEFAFSEATRAQVAGRIEHVRLTGTATEFPADFLPGGGAVIAADRTLEFTPKSVSVGLIQQLPWDLVGSVTGQRVERAPKPAELFSRGPHDATATFDIGDPNLKIETASSVEAGIRRAKGPFRFEATAYYTRFNGFIFRQLTRNTCDEDFDSCIAGDGAELNQAVYSQRDAVFRGGELQAQWDALPLGGGFLGVDGQYDIVRATFTDGTNVPRIPPQRLGGGVYWRDPNWFARVGLLHAFDQNKIAENETPTKGYDLLRAELVYRTVLPPSDAGPRELNAGIVGTNLLNDDVRNHVSFTKDDVLLPGAGVRLFATIKY
ncbi:MAG TPA: TonB-dependent receptor [Xanthobacteraceae bacterium]|nr:TonB-dependent receptor [Xanthobacteraceae bacterium]